MKTAPNSKAGASLLLRVPFLALYENNAEITERIRPFQLKHEQ